MVDRGSRKRRTISSLVAGGLGLVLLVTFASWWVGHRAVAQVSATTAVPDCDRTEVVHTDLEDGFTWPAIPLNRNFSCTLTIRVVNDSGREVRLGRLSVPFGGPGGGAGYRVTDLDPAVAPGRDEMDARTDLEQTLGPEASGLLQLRLTFRESGCTPQGVTMTITPTIEVRDLLASRDLQVADLPVLLGTADSSCDT